jgi:hypothetical protein
VSGAIGHASYVEQEANTRQAIAKYLTMRYSYVSQVLSSLSGHKK